MASSHEHEVVARTLTLRELAASLPPGAQAADMQAAVEALINALSTSGYVFPRTSA